MGRIFAKHVWLKVMMIMFFSDVPIHSHHFRMGICSLMQFGFCFFRVLASIGCGHWNTIVSFDTQNNSAATMFSRSNAQSKFVFRAPPPYPVELSFSFPSQTFGPEELLAKYLDEDQPMRSWLSSKHDEKVQFFFLSLSFEVMMNGIEWPWCIFHINTLIYNANIGLINPPPPGR